MVRVLVVDRELIVRPLDRTVDLLVILTLILPAMPSPPFRGGVAIRGGNALNCGVTRSENLQSPSRGYLKLH